jgi:hypothetical protein
MSHPILRDAATAGFSVAITAALAIRKHEPANNNLE